MSILSVWVENFTPKAAGLYSAVTPLIESARDKGFQIKVYSPVIEEVNPFQDIEVSKLTLNNAIERDLHSSLINHTHGLWGQHSLASMVNSYSSNSPLVISPHGMLDKWALSQSKYKKLLAKFAYENLAFKKASYIHALTNSEADDIRGAFGNKRIEIIPNGVNIPSYVNEKDLSGQINITFLARLHEKKGILELLAAWEEFQSNFNADRLQLIIAGWGEPALENILAMYSAKNCKFIGAVHGEKKDDLLKNSHFFILPSFSEGLPMSVLESWSYGVPCIISKECNFSSDDDKRAIILVKPERKSIVNSLHNILDMTNGDYEALKANSLSNVSRNYSWDVINKTHLDLYREIL